MILRTPGPKVLVPFLITLGLMASMATASSANWLVEGKELAENASVSIQASSSAKFVVTKKSIEINCTKVASSSLKLIGKSAKAEGEVAYSECRAFSPPGSGKESKNCNPINQPIIFALKVLLILHSNGLNYILLEPTSPGLRLAKMQFSELCALTETTEITGSSVDECGNLSSGSWVAEDCNISEVAHLTMPAPAALFPSDVMDFGKNELLLGGEDLVKLVGPFEGKSWAGHV